MCLCKISTQKIGFSDWKGQRPIVFILTESIHMDADEAH